MRGNKVLLGFFFALLATAIWSGNFVVARHLAHEIQPIILAFLRWSIAFFVFTPFALKGFIRDWTHIKNNIRFLLLVSLLGVTSFNTFIYIAGHTTSAMNLSLISITFPVMTLILARFYLNERLSRRKVLGVIVVLIGVLTMMTKGDFDIIWQLKFVRGDIWMLLAAFIFAVYSFLLKSKPKALSIFTFQYATFGFGLLMLLPFFLWEISSYPLGQMTLNTMGSLLYVGIFASLIAFLFWQKSVLYIGPSKASIVYYTLPIFSGILAYFLLNEYLTYIHILSGLLIFTGILLSTLDKKSN